MKDIYEEKPLLVQVRSVNGEAGAENVKFQFFKDGEQFIEVDAKTPSKKVLADKGWLEAKCTPPKVDDDKQSYQLTYKAIFDGEEKKDFPFFVVWPKTGTLKVIKDNDADRGKGFKGFRFILKQDGKKQGETKRITEDSGVYEFDLIKGEGFSVEAEHPYQFLTPPVKDKGRTREHKRELDFQATFITPNNAQIAQWVNLIPNDLTVTNLGQDQKGPIVVIKIGVKGDADLPDDQKIASEGMIVHFRVTFGLSTEQKSKRVDSNYKTEIKAELDVESVDDSAKPKYTGKLKLGADGTGSMKVYLGLAGLDTCIIEIAGSDKFINDDTINADAKMQFTNWRKLYYELMAPDFYRDRELEDRVDNNKVGAAKNHIDFPQTGLTKLEGLGDSVGIKYEFEAAQIFAKADSPAGNVLSKRFLEIDGTEDDAYILTDYTSPQLPTGTDWAKTKDKLSNYVKLCDANYYWERQVNAAGTDYVVFPSGRKLFTDDVFTTTPSINVSALGGYFIPVSGQGASSGGTGRFSCATTDGSEGIEWVASVNPDNMKTVVSAIVDDISPGSKSKTRILTISESNQNPAACVITYTKKKLQHIPTSLTDTQKGVIDAWVAELFVANELRANGNKVSVTVKGDSGSSRRDDRFENVKNHVQTKLNELKASHSISVHPGLDDAGDPRKGVLLFADVNMATSTRKIIKINLPAVNPEDPGDFVGPAETQDKCPITLTTYIEAHKRALVLCEDVDVLGVFAKANAAVDICTTMHELGHSYGMCVYGASDKPPKGMARPKKFDEDEIDLYKHPNGGDKGHAYDKHNHSGSHCAYGLLDAQKAGASYQAAGYSAAAKCVMFGAGGVSRTLCPQCVDLFRGANLTVLPIVKGS